MWELREVGWESRGVKGQYLSSRYICPLTSLNFHPTLLSSIIALLFLLLPVASGAQNLLVPATGNNNVGLQPGSSCTLLDPGSNSNYPPGCDGTLTLSSMSGTAITLSGTYYTEYNCDFLYIYDGTTTGSTLLGTFTGVGPINVTAISGSVTLRFYSDQHQEQSGFTIAATVCNEPVDKPFGITADNATPTSITLSWSDTTPATQWTVQYGTQYTDLNGIVTTSTPSATLTNLDIHTQYYYRVFNGSSDSNDFCATRLNRFRTLCVETPPLCIDYSNLTSCYVSATYGTYINPQQSSGIIDYGSQSQLSRHTVHSDTSERDSRTGNQLRTVPEGYSSSIRLGNWSNGGEAESITYEYTVDTLTNDLLIMKYAAVLQDPNHNESQQPRFTFQILDANGNEVDNLCYSANFVASSGLGWNIVPGSGTPDNPAVLWKDWTTVGIDLSPLHGETIHIRLTTYDCARNDHYGYAYFVFDCATKMLLAETCGAEIENTFTAPEGFSYRWYDITRPDSTLATTQSLHVTQAGEYHCAMQFVGATTSTSCSFELIAIAGERYPAASFSLDSLDRDGCDLPLTLQNTSVLSLDTARTQLTTHPCDHIQWAIDGDSVSDAQTLSLSLPPGQHTITLVASLRGGCTDTVTKSLFVWNPCYVADTIAATICQGQSYTLFDTTISEPGTYIRDSAYHHRTLMLSVNPTSDTVITRSVKEALFPYSFAGISFSAAVADTSIILANSHNCDSTIHFTLIPLPNSLTTVDSSVCQNLLPLVWNGITFSHSDTLSVTIVDAASNGADSIVTMQLHVKPTYQSFDTIALCDNQFPYIWNDTVITPTGNAQFSVLRSQFSVQGCDSLLHLTLFVNPTYDTTYLDTICDNQFPYTWNDTTITSTGTAQLSVLRSLFSAQGCDSILRLNLIVNPTYNTTYYDTICDNQFPYSWNDTILNPTGTAQFSVLSSQFSAQGCDSILHLVLNVNPTYQSLDTTILCDNQFPYPWLDTIINYDGTAQFSVLSSQFSAQGCDSLLHLTLFVNPTYDTTYFDTLCDNHFPYPWLDTIITYDGTAQLSVLRSQFSVQGCDSIQRLQLTVHPTQRLYDHATVCNGAPYTWIDGNTYTQSTYDPYVALTNIYGCDSIVHLVLDLDNSFNASMQISPTVVTPDQPTVHLRDLSQSRSRRWYCGDATDTARITTFVFPAGTDSITILLVARSAAGCIDSVTGTVHCDLSTIWPPNAFTPDQPTNSRFFIPANDILAGEVLVYTRQGLLVTRFDLLTGSWDGTKGGLPCPQGTYTWVMRYTTKAQPDNQRQAKGTVTLLR